MILDHLGVQTPAFLVGDLCKAQSLIQTASTKRLVLNQAVAHCAGPPGCPIRHRFTLSTPGVTPDRFGALKRPCVS